jgi:carbamoyl-phosphate synthase large subunit
MPALCRESLNVLVTGVGSPAASGVIRSLRRVPDWKIRVTGVDINPNATGAVWCDDFHVVPRALEPLFPKTILQLCQKQSIDVIVPLVTKELEVLAAMQLALQSSHTHLALSTQETLRIANHKGLLLNALLQHSVKVPNFVTAKNVTEFQQAIQLLSRDGQPVCFKPIYGDGSRGFHIIDERFDEARRLFEDKPDSTYVSKSELLRVIHGAKHMPELVVMEYLPGDEYSVDVLARNGETLVAIPRLREQMVNGITTKGVIVNHTDVVLYVKRVVAALSLHGNVGVQVRRNAAGEVRILEVNPRLQGTTVHCTAAGVNLPWLGIKLALSQPISDEELHVRYGTRMMRHWSEIFITDAGELYTI